MAGNKKNTNFFSKIKFWGNNDEAPIINEKEEKQITADFGGQVYNGGSMTPIWTWVYNGEKNLGEMGPIKNYYLDYPALRFRAWQAYLESDIVFLLANKMTKWIIGKGLKVQCNPNNVVFESEGLKDFQKEKFNEVTEARFSVWANSINSDYSNMNSLDSLSKICFKDCKIGGDTLCVLRYIDNTVKLQLIDGEFVVNPVGITDFNEQYENGNIIRNGVELDSKGNQVAYHVRKKGVNFETERIAAYGPKTGLKMAWLVYGTKYRSGGVRGVPFIVTILEVIAKLERYREASVGSAEERAKIVYAIEHDHFSTGENPLAKVMTKAYDVNAPLGGDQLPYDDFGNKLADTIAVSTDKQTFNLPIGAHLKALASSSEQTFDSFFNSNFDIICAVINMPPNIAASKYNDSFSASRAAINDWGHTMVVEREDFKSQFFQPIYNFWLHTEILKMKINAPGYLEFYNTKNNMGLDSYRTIRVSGLMFPHIDPEKEVAAERAKLGDKFANVPLTTVEQAVENLNTGDSDSNIEQAAEEYKAAEKLGFEFIEPKPAIQNTEPTQKKSAQKKEK